VAKRRKNATETEAMAVIWRDSRPERFDGGRPDGNRAGTLVNAATLLKKKGAKQDRGVRFPCDFERFGVGKIAKV